MLKIRKKGNLLYENDRKEIRENMIATLKRMKVRGNDLSKMIEKEQAYLDQKGLAGWHREASQIRLDAMWEYWHTLPALNSVPS